jgi:hypothetical protein
MNSAFWTGVDESIRQPINEVIAKEKLEDSLRESNGNLITIDEKYSLLRTLVDQELDGRSVKGVDESPRIKLLAHLQTMLQTTKSDLQQEATAWQLVLCQRSPSKPVYSALYNLAFVLEQQKKYLEAECLHRAMVPLLQLRIGDDSPQAIGSFRRLASCVAHQGRTTEAVEILNTAR